MTGFSATAVAQSEYAAEKEQIAAVLKSKPADLKEALKPFKKVMKKAEVLAFTSQTFLELKDTANALNYAKMALERDSKCGDAYIILGDIAAVGANGGEAAKHYEQAIYLDPKSPEAYYKYANVYSTISPSQAVDKLEQLRTQRPDLPVDGQIGHVYFRANMFKEAGDAFAKANGNLEERYVTENAMALYFSQQYQKSLDVVKAGLAKNPRVGAFNRLAMFNYTELQDYANALVYADALFNKSDSAKISYMDYTYYGNALSGNKQYAEAVDMYKKALEQEIDSKDKRAGVHKTLSDAYKQVNDFDNAAASYKEYITLLGTNTATDMAGLANIYVQHGNFLTDSVAKLEKLQQAEAVYVEMAKNPDATEYATFWRARVNTMMDPESKAALAKPHYETLAGMIEPKAEKSKSDNARLIESYRYLGAYYWLVVNDKEQSDIYWNKILAIDPTNEVAIQALGVGQKKDNK